MGVSLRSRRMHEDDRQSTGPGHVVSAVLNPSLRSLAASLEADDGAPRKLHSIVSVVGMEDDDYDRRLEPLAS